MVLHKRKLGQPAKTPPHFWLTCNKAVHGAKLPAKMETRLTYTVCRLWPLDWKTVLAMRQNWKTVLAMRLDWKTVPAMRQNWAIGPGLEDSPGHATELGNGSWTGRQSWLCALDWKTVPAMRMDWAMGPGLKDSPGYAIEREDSPGRTTRLEDGCRYTTELGIRPWTGRQSWAYDRTGQWVLDWKTVLAMRLD